MSDKKGEPEQRQTQCINCRGIGQVNADNCTHCHGTGQVAVPAVQASEIASQTVVDYEPIQVPELTDYPEVRYRVKQTHTMEEWWRLLGPFLYRDVVVSELKCLAAQEEQEAIALPQDKVATFASKLGASRALQAVAKQFEGADTIVDETEAALGINRMKPTAVIPALLSGCCKEHRLKAEGCKVCEPTFAAIKEVALMLQAKAEAQAAMVEAQALFDEATIADDNAPRNLVEGGYGEVYEHRRELLRLVRRLRTHLR